MRFGRIVCETAYPDQLYKPIACNFRNQFQILILLQVNNLNGIYKSY